MGEVHCKVFVVCASDLHKDRVFSNCAIEWAVDRVAGKGIVGDIKGIFAHL